MLYSLRHWLGKTINAVGYLCAVLMLLMIINVFFDVVMRYLFNDVSIGMQEMEWHLFAGVFLLGIGYTIKENEHVRVDVFYENFGPTTRALVNIIGTVLFLLPFSGIVAYYGYDFFIESYRLGEKSGDPGGMNFRWIIKSIIPLSFLFNILCGIYVVTDQTVLIIESRDKANKTDPESGL